MSLLTRLEKQKQNLSPENRDQEGGSVLKTRSIN